MSKQNEQEKAICFVIMPFSDPDGYEKGHFKKIYEQIFTPAIEAAGYTPHRVDENNESTLIQGKLLDQLVNAPMVLCDLSAKNPNVLYELGIRHAFDKPVVLVQEAGQAHIFDVAGIATVEYRKARLYDEVVEDQKKIASAIQQTANTKKNYSIMSLAKLTHAKISQDDSFSEEDRIEIFIRDIAQKLSKMEEKISGISLDAGKFPVWKIDDTTEKGKLRENHRDELENACNMAEMALRMYKQNGKENSTIVHVAYERLSTAIKTWRGWRDRLPGDDLLARALTLKEELTRSLVEIQANT